MNEGLNEILFHLLWTKDKVFDSVVKAIVPHTVIFQYYQPRFWYFTALEGVIKRKSKEKLTLQQIQYEFLKKISQSGIVALLFFIDDSKRVVEYLTEEKFKLFINEKKTHKDMILQKFVDPKGSYNSSFSILWTTNFCLFEKKTNKVELYNEKYDIYERAVTFEGKDYHVLTSPVRGSSVPHRLLKTADSIVSHISAVTFEKMKVLRMILQFRIGEGDRLWLMCATSLRFDNDPERLPLELNAEFELPKDHSSKNLTVDSRKPAVFAKNKQCACCLEFFESSKVVEVEYARIFKILKHEPTPIYNLHPKVSKEDIQRLRTNEYFLSKTATMCFECYIKLNEHKEIKTHVSLPLIGTGPLRPKIVKKNHGMSSTRYDSLDVLSSSNSVLPNSLVSPSIITHSSTNKTIFSTRTSKTAGGELLISFPASRIIS